MCSKHAMNGFFSFASVSIHLIKTYLEEENCWRKHAKVYNYSCVR